MQKCLFCRLIRMSGARENLDFDSNTTFLPLTNPELKSPWLNANEFFLFFEFGTFNLNTEDKILDYISNVGNSMRPDSIAVGQKVHVLLFDHFYQIKISIWSLIENEKIEEGTWLTSPNKKVDPYDYHVLKCGENLSSKMRKEEIHSFYKDNDEETTLGV